jgi:NADPH:quinone reductase
VLVPGLLLPRLDDLFERRGSDCAPAREWRITFRAVRAVVCRRLGPLDNVVITEHDEPHPGPGQVVVDVRAAGANYVDGLMCEGRYQVKFPTPYVPGGEVAGVVSALGEGVEEFEVGDRVMAMCAFGAFAERVAVSVASLAHVPEGLSFGRAAAFIQSYSTALFALDRRASLSPGESVLVLGAGGGIGLASADVAIGLGATVIAAASSEEKLAAAKSMGAQSTIAYEHEDLKSRVRELSGGGVDIAVDPVGGRHSEPALRALRPFGRLCVIGFASGTIPAVPLNQVLLSNRAVLGVDWGAWAMRDPSGNRRLLNELLEMLLAKRLHPVEPVERPLEDAVTVMRELLDRSTSGKVVLVP